MKNPAVYILTNKKNGTLYVGVTTNIVKRLEEHRSTIHNGFTQKYGCTQLVYIEFFETIISAIEGEKQLKAGSRKKKLLVIEQQNPNWLDLSAELISL